MALVIFARWNPMLCFWRLAAVRRRRSARAGAAIGRRQPAATYLFNAAPYILTLLIMIVTSSPKRTLIGAPAELSVTK